MEGSYRYKERKVTREVMKSNEYDVMKSKHAQY